MNHNIKTMDGTRDFKLIEDPFLTRVSEPVYRYGVLPTEKRLLDMVDPRPRMARLGFKKAIIELKVPEFVVDQNYMLPLRPKQVTFSNLNNNVNLSFLTSMCSPYGPIHYHHIYYHPVSKAHLGLATVVFEKSSSAQKCVEKLHKTPCMGNIMNVVLDEKGLEKERTYRELLTDTKRSEFHPVSLQACNENADKNIIKVPTVTNGISSQPLPRLGHSTSFHNTHKNTPNISSENSFASYRRKSANESSNSFTTYNSYSQYKNSTKYNELYNCAKNNGFKNDSGYDYNKNKMAKSEKERGRFGREDSRRWLEKGGKDRWNEKIDGGNDRRMKDRGWRDMNNDKKDRNHRDEKRYSKSDKRRHKNDYPRKHRDSYDRDSFDGRSRDGRRRDDRKDGDDVTKNSFFPSRVSSKTSTETVEVTNDVASSSSRHRLSSSSSHKEDAHESLESRIQALLSQFIPQPPPSPTDPPHLLSPFSSPQIVVTSSSSVYLNHKHFSPFYSHPTTPLDTPFTPTYQSTTSFNNTPTTPISFYQKVPPPNLAQTITVQNPEPSSTDTYTHADQHKDEITHEKRRAKNNKSLEENYHDVTKELSIQIKEVLRKDIKKRLTEMHAFPIYEQWWSSKNENNMSLSSLSIGKTLSHSNISAPAAPIANPLSTILERQGGILGLKGSTWLSSLPSFKKKSGPPRQDFHARSWDDRRTKNKKIDKKGINDRNIENERRSVNDRRMNECEDEEDEEEWRKNKKKTFKGPRTPEASDAEDGVRDRMGKRESRDDVGRHAKNKSKTFSNVTKNSEKNKKSLSKKDNEKMINKNKLNEKNKENIKIDHKKAIKNRSLPFVYSSPSSQSSLSSDSEVSIGDYQEETGMCKNNNNKYLLSKNNFSADDDDDDDDDVSDVDVIGLVKPSTKLGNIYTTDEDSDVDVDDKRRLSSSLSSSSSGLSSDAEVNKAKETKPVISETKGVKNGGQKAKKDNDFEDYVSKKHKAMVKQKKQKPADKKEVKKHRYNSINDDDDDFVAGNAYKRQRKNSYKSKTTKKISDKSNVRINNDIDEDNSVDVDDSKSLVEQKSKQINTKNSPLSNNDYYIDYLELLSSVASSLSHKKVDSGLEPATNDLKQEPANHSTDGGMKVDNKGRKDVGMVESKEVLHRVKLIEMDHKYPLHHSLEVKSKKGRRPKKRFSSLPHDSYDSSGCETVGIDDGGAEEVGGGEVMRVASVDACVNETDKVRLVASNLYCEHSYCFSIAHFFLNSDELKRSKVVCDDVYDNYSTPDEVFVNGVSYVEKDMGGGGMVKGVVDVNGGRFVREYVPNIACEFDVEMKETTKNVEDEDEEEEGEYHSSEKEMKIEKFEELKKKKRKLSVTDDIPKNKKSKLQRSSNTSKASRELANLLPGAVAAVATKAPKFKKRDFTAETKVLYKIVTECIDLEDAMYLERQFKAMIEDSEAPAWVRMTRWGEYSISKQAGFPIISPKKKTRRRDVVEFHKTGSCRTEGYYKVSHQTKRYLRSIQGTELHSDNNEDNTTSNNHVQLLTPKSSSASNLASTEASLELVLKKRAQQTRQARMEGRRLQTLISFNLEPTDLLKFNQLKLRKKHLKFTRSRIHDWGLFAMEPISEGEFVIEYVGETVRQSVADLRERRYEKEGLGGSSYLFRIDANNIVDATKMGNLARFINHSCNPNCCARIVSVDGTSRIVIYSRREIEVNEEITYDYKFPYEDDKIPCLCGAQGCRGTLN